MNSFIRIGDSLVNLRWVRAVEYAADGRMNVYLSEPLTPALSPEYRGEGVRPCKEAGR